MTAISCDPQLSMNLRSSRVKRWPDLPSVPPCCKNTPLPLPRTTSCWWLVLKGKWDNIDCLATNWPSTAGTQSELPLLCVSGFDFLYHELDLGTFPQLQLITGSSRNHIVKLMVPNMLLCKVKISLWCPPSGFFISILSSAIAKHLITYLVVRIHLVCWWS